MVWGHLSPVLSSGIFLSSFGALQALAYTNSLDTNLAVYWGQNSYGATHTDTANWQQNLSYYCQDDTIDAIPMAFLNVFFDTGGLPSLDLSNICNVNDNVVFNGTDLPDCSFMAADIATCQAAGKIVTMSLGGATGSDTFTSDDQAVTFANTIWDLLLGGTSDTRPFGTAVLDGIDLDIEGGSSTGYAAFVTQIRTLATGASKPYYITGAPQCPFPDAYLGTVIDAVGFDALYVQFYNNYCGLTSFSDANDWDFETWDNWAKTTSPNPDIKIYIGAPASSTAAGSGYVDASTLATIIDETRGNYSSFGGVMLWDASQAYANDRYDMAAKSALTDGGPTAASTTPPTTATTATTTSTTSTTSSTTTTTTATVGQGQCAGVATWVSNVAYTAGDQVVYGGYLWTANWWSEADEPGGASGDWANDGICSSAATVRINIPAYDITPTLAPVPPASGDLDSRAAAEASVVQPTTPARRYSRFFKD